MLHFILVCPVRKNKNLKETDVHLHLEILTCRLDIFNEQAEIKPNKPMPLIENMRNVEEIIIAIEY